MGELLGSLRLLGFITLGYLWDFLVWLYKGFLWIFKWFSLPALIVVFSLLLSSKASAGYNDISEIPEEKWKVIEVAWKQGLALGYSEASVAGMLGNANEESTFQTDITEVGGFGGFGFFQWTNTPGSPRRTAFENYAKEKGLDLTKQEDSARASMIYADYELQQTPNTFELYYDMYIVQRWGRGKDYPQHSKTLDDFKKSKDPKIAAAEFTAGFERPAVDTLDKRAKIAQQLYDKYKGKLSADGEDAKTDSNSNSNTSVSRTTSRWKPDEDKVPNMPKDRDYGDTVGGGLSNFTERLQGQEKLETDEAFSIAKWREEREWSLQRETVRWTRVVLMAVSLLLLTMPTVLILAFIVDTWFVWLDSPVLRFISGNRLAVDLDGAGSTGMWFADKKKYKNSKVKRLGAGDLLVWSCIFSIVGILGITGYMYQTVGGIWQYLMDAMGGFL